MVMPASTAITIFNPQFNLREFWNVLRQELKGSVGFKCREGKAGKFLHPAKEILL